MKLKISEIQTTKQKADSGGKIKRQLFSKGKTRKESMCFLQSTHSCRQAPQTV